MDNHETNRISINIYYKYIMSCEIELILNTVGKVKLNIIQIWKNIYINNIYFIYIYILFIYFIYIYYFI